VRATQGFSGTERYEVQRVLGAGGMGVVYEVLDRTRGSRVALKTLRRLDAAAIYRFKREFRAIARTAHPNLVALYELVAESDRCFFTMEMVEGVDFLRYVGHSTWPGAVTDSGPPSLEGGGREEIEPLPRHVEELVSPLQSTRGPRGQGDYLLEPGGPSVLAPSSGRPAEALPLPARVVGEGVIVGLDEARLRSALRQLTEGVMALHRLGCLHRDIKPSNVLVTAEGRLVLLDLGLVTWINPLDASFERYVAGTAAYMSPEQGMAKALTEASDWYSVGVMLYEAITGSRPFRGTFEQIVARKQVEEPRLPSELAENVSEPLESLCMDLLRIQPGERPGGDDILRRLRELPGGLPDVALPPVSSISLRAAEAAFVGRGHQLGLMREAWQAALDGRCQPVHLHGVSGMGKSALLRQFLHEISGGRDPAIVLSGRCYERESVPFKAVDGIVDALSRYLRSLPRVRADGLLPGGTARPSPCWPAPGPRSWTPTSFAVAPSPRCAPCWAGSAAGGPSSCAWMTSSGAIWTAHSCWLS
jgi:serine/threonine protein kinase